VSRARARLLPDGRRLHLQDGPIDLVIEALGRPSAIAAAYRAATARFDGLLDELCRELSELRRPTALASRLFASPVAQRMERAVVRHASVFVTPMAAVAGAVSDEILSFMLAAAGEDLTRALVNNGGDIALWLAAGETTRLGLVGRPDDTHLFARAVIAAGDGVGGIATSGAPGRSFSLGIADAVTVLATTAAEADAAATMVANAVDLPGDPRVTRVPARELQSDSDLGDRLVTRRVAALDEGSIARALARGVAVAAELKYAGFITAAALHLQGETRLVADEYQSLGAPGTAGVPCAAAGGTPAVPGGGGSRRHLFLSSENIPLEEPAHA